MNKKGFTLIEVITVLVLIALVLALAAPNIFKFRDRANEKALQSKIDTLATSIENYIENNSNNIVYQCNNHNSNCICSSFSNSGVDTYTCSLKIQTLLDLSLYNETCKKEDKSLCKCKISNPKSDTVANCLENKYFNITINLNSNTAKATYVE